MFLAIGRALQLALERVWQAEEREARLAELERRQHVLEVFAELGRDVAVESDPFALIHQAERVLLTLLPGAFVQYWTEHGDQWQIESRVGQPVEDPLWDVLSSEAHGPFASVHAPRQQTQQQSVRVHGTVRGVLEVTRRDPHAWTPADRAVLDTVAYHLGLALERAEQVQGLKERSQALKDQTQQEHARQDASDAFTLSVWRDMRREVAAIDAAESEAEVSGRAKVLLNRLDGLLEYAELSRRPLQPALVNLRLLVQEVQNELKYERSIQWQLGDLPTVRADRELLRRVLLELLTNAENYSRGERVSVIEVWSEPGPTGRTISVRNTGEGFDPSFAELIFEPEQQGQPGGLMERGMGLAIVKRLVERHGGRVWAVSQPGQSATFAFTLPE